MGEEAAAQTAGKNRDYPIIRGKEERQGES